MKIDIGEFSQWAFSELRIGTWKLLVESNELWWSDITYDIHEVERGSPVSVEEAINFYIEEHRPIIEQHVKESSVTGNSYNVELMIRTATNKTKWVQAIGRAVKDGEKVLYLEGLFLDIDRFKRGEFDLQNALMGYASFNNALTNQMIVTRTNIQGEITFANDKFLEISGYDESEIIGENHRLINSGHHTKEFWKEFWNTILAKKPWRGKIKNKAKDKTDYWVDTLVIPILDKDDEVSEFLSIRTDITEESESNSRASESEKLALVGETTAQIFHDVMNPLTIILLTAQKLRKKAPEDHDPKPYDTIVHSVQRVQNMFGEVRDLLHEEKENIDVRQTANLKSIINKALELVCLKLEQNNVHVDAQEIDEDLLIYGSELQFTQVVINVINNAVDAIKNLDEKWITIKVASIGSYIHVGITDSGSGIPEELQNKIFKNLFSTKRKEGGTGLGLGICRKILRRYGGDININTKSENTSFVLSFKYV